MGLEAYIQSDNHVIEQVYHQRKAICHKCNGFNVHYGTCGRPVLGERAIREDSKEEIKLCGCFISEKAKFKSESCPAGKW